MNKLAKRNKINVIGTVLLYDFINVILLVGLLMLGLVFTIDDGIITIIWTGIIFLIIVIFSIVYLIKNTKELHKILKLLKSKPEYYLEISNDKIKVSALDGEYTINFADIGRLNYSYDRPLISANFLQMYGNWKYKLNTNSEKLKSTYIMFDLSNEFVQGLKNKKNKTRNYFNYY